MNAPLLTLQIFISIKLSFVLFFVYRLWRFRLTNLDNQVKMQIELIEALEQIKDQKDI